MRIQVKTYAQIKAEIARLEKQAENTRKAEIAGVVGRIKEAIAAYGLTAADLGFGKGSAADKSAKKASNGRDVTSVGVAKYRDPTSGKTWTGRGKPPNWILGVKNRDDFLISAEQPAAAAEKATRKTKAASAKRRPGRKQRASKRKTAVTPASVQIESAAAQ